MTLEMKDIELLAYNVIRRKTNNILNPISNEELGSFVRGVVDLESEIYKEEGIKNQKPYNEL